MKCVLAIVDRDRQLFLLPETDAEKLILETIKEMAVVEKSEGQLLQKRTITAEVNEGSMYLNRAGYYMCQEDKSGLVLVFRPKGTEGVNL